MFDKIIKIKCDGNLKKRTYPSGKNKRLTDCRMAGRTHSWLNSESINQSKLFFNELLLFSSTFSYDWRLLVIAVPISVAFKRQLKFIKVIFCFVVKSNKDNEWENILKF